MVEESLATGLEQGVPCQSVDTAEAPTLVSSLFTASARKPKCVFHAVLKWDW